MAVVNVIELLGESEQGWEDATRKVVGEATRTVRGVIAVYIKVQRGRAGLAPPRRGGRPGAADTLRPGLRGGRAAF